MMTDHPNPSQDLTRRFLIPIGSVVITGLLAIGAFLFFFNRIPVPQLPPSVYKLRAAGLGDRLYLFLAQRDTSSSSPRDSEWMKTVEGGQVKGESEIKPFQSLAAFSGKLWFFNPGMYRVFDGKEWQRFDAPWVGADPVAASTPEQLWILSRIGGDFLLTVYSHDVWDRPISVAVDPKDKELFCAEPCSSGLLVFKETIHYFWLKDGHLYHVVFDGLRPGRVESMDESFGRLKGFSVLAEPDRILLWYLPESVPARAGEPLKGLPVGLKIFDGNQWHDEPGLERPAPVGLLEIAPLTFRGETHLLINTGIRIEDRIWGQGPSGRSVFLMGGELGRSVLRYHENVLFLLLVTIALAGAAASSLLDRLKAVPEAAHLPYASVRRRFMAKAIDTALVVVPVGLAVWSRLDPESLLTSSSLSDLITAGGRGAMIAPLLLFTYHAAAEGLWGQTLGKRLCGIIVMDSDLKRCTMLQSVVRNLLRLADGICLYGVGLVFIAATDRWQRLGDVAGRTVVVRIKP